MPGVDNESQYKTNGYPYLSRVSRVVRARARVRASLYKQLSTTPFKFPPIRE